jgi:hypothetical protein
MAKVAASKGNGRPGTKSKPARESAFQRAIRRYCRPGARERAVKILEPGLVDLLRQSLPKKLGSRRKRPRRSLDD